ncbi:MAG: hypothetical protein R6W72_04620 [Desulfurivibrionaceae bacterium]
MANPKKENQPVEEELAAYEKLRKRVGRILGDLNEKINTESISQAMEKAKEELKGAGEHSRETIARVGETLKKDIASSIGRVKPGMDKGIGAAREDFNQLFNRGGALWRELSSEAERLGKLSLDKGGSFLLHVTRGLSEWTGNLSDKLDSSLSYKTGEVTHGGEFACTACGGAIHLKKPGRLPPCPKCSKTEFRRT